MRTLPRGALLTAAFLALPLAAGGCGGKPTSGDPQQIAQPPGDLRARGPASAGVPPPGLGGPGGPPRPGQLLPPFLQEQLNLTPEQKKQLEELQHEADRKLQAILTEGQRKQFQEMQQGFGRGPGFPPPPPGPPPGGPE